MVITVKGYNSTVDPSNIVSTARDSASVRTVSPTASASPSCAVMKSASGWRTSTEPEMIVKTDGAADAGSAVAEVPDTPNTSAAASANTTSLRELLKPTTQSPRIPTVTGRRLRA